MALKFGNTKGTAQKKVDTYTYKDGLNTVRIVGDVLARYVYWLKGTNNKDIPVECLAFNRDEEKFDNKEYDHVPTFFPTQKCSWNYAVKCIDPTDGKLKVLNLKKKLFEQIMSAAEDLGDPTDVDNGWALVFKKVKDGPLAYNVTYTLQVLKCVNSPLTDAEKELVANGTTIDEDYPRPTPDEVKTLLVKITTKGDDDDQEPDDSNLGASEQEAVNELSQ